MFNNSKKDKMKRAFILFTIFIAMGSIFSACKGGNEDARNFKHTYKAAFKGDAESQYNTAMCYYNGVGIEKDVMKGTEWIMESAKNGYVPAQLKIADAYFTGSHFYGANIPKIEREAVKWYKLAAEQGNVSALVMVVLYYHYGHGDDPENEAAKWFELLAKTAEEGDAEAQFYLGECLYRGIGVEECDKEESVKWLTLAAEQDWVPAQIKLGWCYEHGEGVEADGREAFKWYGQAAKQKSPVGQYLLAMCHYNGTGVIRDYGLAIEEFLLAAEQGNPYAQYYAGICFYKGQGVTMDFKHAYNWFVEAVEHEDFGGVYCEDDDIAFNKFKEATVQHEAYAKQMYAEAAYMRGMFYHFAYGTPKNDEEAVWWLSTAAKMGHEEAEKLLKTIEN